jgi:hypothetical protein
MAGLSTWAGGLAERYGARLPLVVGPLVTGGALLSFVLLGEGSYATTLLPGMALLGFGMAIAVAPLTTTVLASVAESEAGVASGVNNTVARVAALLAVAVVGSIALAAFHDALAPRLAAIPLSPSVRSAVEARRGGLGEVALPPSASAAERNDVQQAVAAALATSFRAATLIAAVLAAAAAGLAALMIGREPSPVLVGEEEHPIACAHLESIVDVAPRSEGCEDCLRLGTRWVHLRICLSCGHVGCCDASSERHATVHFWSTDHPIVRSLEPGETWRWCYIDDVAL